MNGEQGPDMAPTAVAGVTVAAAARALADVLPACDSAGLINQIRELEDAKSAAAASQARLTVTLESPAKGGRHLGLAKALVTEMPHTLAALETHGIGRCLNRT